MVAGCWGPPCHWDDGIACPLSESAGRVEAWRALGVLEAAAQCDVDRLTAPAGRNLGKASEVQTSTARQRGCGYIPLFHH